MLGYQYNVKGLVKCILVHPSGLLRTYCETGSCAAVVSYLGYIKGNCKNSTDNKLSTE